MTAKTRKKVEPYTPSGRPGMEKNLNPLIVVMDRDQFDFIMGVAGIGSNEVSRDNQMQSFERHIRRFNPHIAAQAAEERKAEAEEYRRLKDHAKMLATKYIGKEVFLIDTQSCYIPSKLLGLSKSKIHVRISGPSVMNRNAGIRECEVNPGNIAVSVPEGWRFIIDGYWAGTWQPPNTHLAQ